MAYLEPDWPAPDHVKALITQRVGGQSKAPFDQLNLGFHVGDNVQDVAANWQQLLNSSTLPSLPVLLNQVHGDCVIALSDAESSSQAINADGIYTQQVLKPCAILTADCLPVLLCDKQGTQVAAIHAGWRGLAKGVIDKGVARFAGKSLMAYLGPAICANCFQVGSEVRHAFIESFSTQSRGEISRQAIEACFTQQDGEHYLANLYQLARIKLNQLGVYEIYGGHHCTVEQSQQFYSYRKDGTTGRFASVIWLQA